MCSTPEKWFVAVGAAVAVGLAGSARAQSYTFTLEQSGGRVTCKRTAADLQRPADGLEVKLAQPDLAPGLRLYLEDGKEVAPGATENGLRTWRLPRSGFAGNAGFQLRDAADATRAKVQCDPSVLASGPTRTGPAPDADAGAPDPAIDPSAATWWQTTGASELDALARAARLPPKTRFLVHFASGEPAAPFPESVPEGTPMQVVLVVDAEAPPSATLTVNACAGLQPFRVRQAPPSAPEPGKLEGRGEPRYALVAFGRTIVCGAGPLSYTLKLGGAEHTQAVRVRPVYHLSATVAYGFDFVRQPTFSAPDGVVRRSADRTGLTPRLGFTWFPLGVDYEDFRAWNAFTNVVFAVDPNAPTERFLVGTALTPSGGFGVIVGASFERIAVLKHGVRVGDAFAGPGDVPTEKAWRNGGIGLYLGLSVDDDVFTAMKGRLGGP